MATEFETWFSKEWLPVREHTGSWEIDAFFAYEKAGGELTASEWEREVAGCVIPPEAWSHPTVSIAQYSWDRRAAWLVYNLLRVSGKTLNESSDLFN